MKALCQSCKKSNKCPAAEIGVYESAEFLDVLPKVADYFGEKDLPTVTEIITECSKYAIKVKK